TPSPPDPNPHHPPVPSGLPQRTSRGALLPLAHRWLDLPRHPTRRVDSLGLRPPARSRRGKRGRAGGLPPEDHIMTAEELAALVAAWLKGEENSHLPLADALEEHGHAEQAADVRSDLIRRWGLPALRPALLLDGVEPALSASDPVDFAHILALVS